MRFTDYFGKAFTAVNSSQFPWAKLFKESPVSKIIDVSFVSPLFSWEYFVSKSWNLAVGFDFDL